MQGLRGLGVGSLGFRVYRGVELGVYGLVV